MSIETERTIIIKNKTMPEVWNSLKEIAYREQDPVMLAGPFKHGDIIEGIFKLMRVFKNGGRSPNDECTGTLKVIPGIDGISIIFDLGDFPRDQHALFRQAADNVLIKLGVITDADRMLLDRDTMCKYYGDYSPTTAKEIIEAIPKAWNLYLEEGGRWGPGIIAKVYTLHPTTIGRYLGAFKKAGLNQIDGIQIP